MYLNKMRVLSVILKSSGGERRGHYNFPLFLRPQLQKSTTIYLEGWSIGWQCQNIEMFPLLACSIHEHDGNNNVPISSPDLNVHS